MLTGLRGTWQDFHRQNKMILCCDGNTVQVGMRCSLCQSLETEKFFNKPLQKMKANYWSCHHCGLIFLDPTFHPNLAIERQQYDFHNNGPEHSGYVEFLQQIVTPLVAQLAPGDQGLDFGCGPGPTISHLLAKQGFSVANYDPIYFPDDKLLARQYEFITATEVAEHFHQPRKNFQQLNQLMQTKRSLLGIMTGVFSGDQSDFATWWYHRDPTHVCFYRQKTLEWIAEWMGWLLECPANNVALFSKRT